MKKPKCVFNYDYKCSECPCKNSCGYEQKKEFNWLPLAIIGWILFCILLMFAGAFKN
jgi:hypothetical protein